MVDAGEWRKGRRSLFFFSFPLFFFLFPSRPAFRLLYVHVDDYGRRLEEVAGRQRYSHDYEDRMSPFFFFFPFFSSPFRPGGSGARDA